jgi:arginine decarboxylase-like protein
MSLIKEKLKETVEELMIPEVHSYLEDLHGSLKDGSATEEEHDAIQEMESFLVELQNIIAVLEEDSISDEEAHVAYHKIQQLIKDSEEH